MATVFLAPGLRRFTGGVEQLDVEARDVRGLIAALDARFPGIAEQLESGVAVAIDGDIVQEPLLEPIAPASEVHFLPSISGGSWGPAEVGDGPKT